MLLAGFVFLHSRGRSGACSGARSPGSRLDNSRASRSRVASPEWPESPWPSSSRCCSLQGRRRGSRRQKAVASAAAGPFLVAAMGFAVMLGCRTLHAAKRSLCPLDRHRGAVGAFCFLITFFTLIEGPAKAACSATAFFLASCRFDLVDSLRASPHTAR